MSSNAIGGVSAASGSGAGGTSAAAAQPGGALGENAFLQLLVAQLKYQDPMQPVDNTQFVTQLAQFQMLTELTGMKTDLDALVAAQPGTGTAGATGTSAASGSGASGGAGGSATGGSGTS